MTVEQGITRPEIQSIPPDEKIFNELRDIIPQIPGFQTAIRSSATSGQLLDLGTFNFNVKIPDKRTHYSIHVILEEIGRNGDRKRKLTTEISFSLSGPMVVDRKEVDNGPFITERVTVCPEDKSERKYHWSINENSREPINLSGDEALPKILGFISLLGLLTK